LIGVVEIKLYNYIKYRSRGFESLNIDSSIKEMYIVMRSDEHRIRGKVTLRRKNSKVTLSAIRCLRGEKYEEFPVKEKQNVVERQEEFFFFFVQRPAVYCTLGSG
jgi:ribosomal protein S10